MTVEECKEAAEAQELEKLGYLKQDRENLLHQGLQLMQADDGKVYPIDFWANAALNRAIALNKGFELLINDANLICAGALVRLMLDTGLRFYAATLVDRPHVFAQRVIKGARVRTLPDRRGNKMTDQHLVKELTKEYPWVASIYEQACSFVHMSEQHVFGTLSDIDVDRRSIQVQISGQDPAASPKTCLTTVQVFRACQRLLVELLESWHFAKANPEKNAELYAERRRAET